MERISVDQFNELLADPSLAGMEPQKVRSILERNNIFVTPEMSAGRESNYASNLAGSLWGGLQRAAGGTLSFAGMLGKKIGPRAFPFTDEGAWDAMEIVGDAVEGIGSERVGREQLGRSGLSRAPLKGAALADEFADVGVGLGMAGVTRKIMLNKSMREATDLVRSGAIDDAARTVDEIIKGTADAQIGEDAVSSAVDVAKKIGEGDPKLFIDNFKSFGRAVAHQMFYRRHAAEVSASRREALFKRVLPDESLRQDLMFYIQKTGNPLHGVDGAGAVNVGDTLEHVTKRIAEHPDGKVAMQVAEHFRSLMDESLDEANLLATEIGDEVIDPVENYVRQAWDFKRSSSARVGGAATIDPSQKKRLITNYREGIVDRKLTPKTTDLAEIWHLYERSIGRTSAAKKLFRDLGDFGSQTLDSGVRGLDRIASDAMVPDGYKVIKNRILDNAMPPIGGEDPGRIIIHKDLYRPVRNLLTANSDGEFARSLDKATSILKRLNFSFSLFHAYSLSESAINALGPVRGAALAGKMLAKGGGIPLPSRWVDEMPGGARGVADLLKPSLIKDNEARAMLHGVKVGAPHSDLMRSVWEEAVGYNAKTKAGKAGMAPVKAYASIQRSFDTALWDRFHHPMKVEVFNRLFDDMLAVKRGDIRFKSVRPFKHRLMKDLENISDDEIGRRIGAFVNDEFGGQAWELLSGKIAEHMADPNGKFMKTAQRVFLSPDWNVSSFRAGTAFTSLFGGDPVRGSLGFRHWRNAMAGTYMYANAANYVLTKAATGEGKFIWENDPGKDFWHIDSGFKDNDGRKIYLRWGKQYQEMAGLMEGIPVLGFLSRKMLPVWQAGLSPWSREGYKTNLGRAAEEAKREARELGLFDVVKGFSADMLDAAMPFGFSGARRLDAGAGKSALLSALPFPKSKGMSLYRAETALAEAYRKADYDEITEIQQALLSNGYPLKKVRAVTKRARSKSRRFR